MLVSPVPDLVDQSMMAHDLGVWFPLGPPDERAPVALAALVIPVIPVQHLRLLLQDHLAL